MHSTCGLLGWHFFPSTGIVDKAKELGIREAFEDKEKARIANVSLYASRPL